MRDRLPVQKGYRANLEYREEFGGQLGSRQEIGGADINATTYAPSAPYITMRFAQKGNILSTALQNVDLNIFLLAE